MQYIKCQHCKYNHPTCRYIMAQAITTLYHLEELVNASQTRKGSSCVLKIDYECTGYAPRNQEEEKHGEV